MGSPVRTALETRASLVSVLRGFFLFFVTLGGWCFGSPVERCALGVLLIVLGHCQAYCKPWLQAVVGCAVFTIGPSSEAYTTYTERAILGAASEACSILWLDTFSFFLMMTITYPLVAAMLNMPLRAYAINLVVILPVGSFFAIGLPPAWAVAHAGRIFCLLLTSFVSSFAIFVSIDQTSREYREKEKAHERYASGALARFRHAHRGAPNGDLAAGRHRAVRRMGQERRREAAARRYGRGAGGDGRAQTEGDRRRQAAARRGPHARARAVRSARAHQTQIPALARYMPHNDQVRVDYFVSEDIAQVILTDGSWVFMMLLNLISNAFKATQMGSVSVSARLAAGRIRLSVADTGVGVSSAVESQLWRAFKQASRWQSGTGLGLYHVNHLAVALGGSVGYQPNIQAGNGSTFWVDLPYTPCTAAGMREGSSHGGMAFSGSKTHPAPRLSGAVLVAEDNLFIQNLTCGLLTSIGVERVVPACNGKEALTALQASDAPDFVLVLMDIQMPFMDGIECTRRVRAWEQQRGLTPVRIIALSANGEDAACQRDCKAAGMDGVLSKPVDQKTLCELLGIGSPHGQLIPSPPTAPTSGTTAGGASGWVDRRAARYSRDETARASPSSSLSQSGEAGVVSFDFEAVKSLTEGDEIRARSMVSNFHALGESPLRGILSACERGDAQGLMKDAHTLKGTCGYMGAPVLQAAALRLQMAAKSAIEKEGPLEVAIEVDFVKAEFERLREQHRLFLDSPPSSWPRIDGISKA